ncbi:hypothetical protein D3C76_506990 [compost metagenome]
MIRDIEHRAGARRILYVRGFGGRGLRKDAKTMRVAGSVPKRRVQGGFSRRSLQVKGTRRRYWRHNTREREAILIFVLFLLLIVVLLYFS